MRIRVKALGTGVTGDPVRAPFPTYGLVGWDPVAGKITIEIPAEDVPFGLDKESGYLASDTVEGTIIHGLGPTGQAKLHAHLDTRYREHAGKYRPEVA